MKSIRHTTNVYTLLVFLYWFANALPLALLILLMQERGLSLLQISVLFGINALTVVLLEVPTGSLADIIGRKQVTIWAALLMMFGFGVFLTAFSFPMLLLGGMIYGASRALASGALDAWFVDTVQAHDPEIDLQPLFAKAGAMTLLGLALGTLLGGIIPLSFDALPLPATPILTKLSLPLAASLMIQVLRLVLVGLLVVEDRPTASRSPRTVISTLPIFIRDAARLSRQSALIRLIFFATVGGGFVMVSLENLWQPHFAILLGERADNTVMFGVIMAGNFVLGAVGNMISTALAQRFGQRLGLLAGVMELLRGAALILLAVQGNVYLATLFFWLVYFGMGISGPAVGTILHSEISADVRSTVLSIQSMLTYLGVFAGSFVLGGLAEWFSIQTAWIVGSVVFFFLFIPYRKIDQLYRPNSQTTQDKADAELQTV